MKKRFISFIGVLAIVLASASTVFAGGLEVTKITPKDGYKSAQPANMAIKLQFNEKMDGCDTTANSEKIKITDPENAEQSFMMVTSEKYPNELWLVLDGTLLPQTTYTVNIEPGIVSADGIESESAISTSFATRNTKRDSSISTILMGVILVAIFFFSSKAQKRQMEEDMPLTMAQAEKLNPYKIAKAKGWKLEEAEAYVKKEKEKAQKAEDRRLEIKRQKEAMIAEEIAAIEAEVDSEERKNGWFRVKTKGSFVEHGHDVPRFVRKKNEAKRKAAEARSKKAIKNKKKK